MEDQQSEEFVFFALRGTAELMRCGGRNLRPDVLVGGDILVHVYVYVLSVLVFINIADG